mmetsp:Transcript_21148/g.37088  ORF Transcript_21148/g.37088 Transcript_21148/m.37088 type:complete len:140 (+) Transcript_21148:298-717(+)
MVQALNHREIALLYAILVDGFNNGPRALDFHDIEKLSDFPQLDTRGSRRINALPMSFPAHSRCMTPSFVPPRSMEIFEFQSIMSMDFPGTVHQAVFFDMEMCPNFIDCGPPKASMAHRLLNGSGLQPLSWAASYEPGSS